MELGNIFRHLLVHNEAFVKNAEETKFLAYATHQNPYITCLRVPIPGCRGRF